MPVDVVSVIMATFNSITVVGLALGCVMPYGDCRCPRFAVRSLPEVYIITAILNIETYCYLKHNHFHRCYFCYCCTELHADAIK